MKILHPKQNKLFLLFIILRKVDIFSFILVPTFALISIVTVLIENKRSRKSKITRTQTEVEKDVQVRSIKDNMI